MQHEVKDARSTRSFCCGKIEPIYTKLVPHSPNGRCLCKTQRMIVCYIKTYYVITVLALKTSKHFVGLLVVLIFQFFNIKKLHLNDPPW